MLVFDVFMLSMCSQEVWTLCRIFKRTPSFKKYTPNLKDSTSVTKSNPVNSNTCTLDSESCKPYLICRDPLMMQQIERKPLVGQIDEKKPLFMGQFGPLPHHQTPSTTPYPNFWNHQNVDDYAFTNENWDELRSVVQFAIDPSSVFDCTETYIAPYFS